MNHTGSGLPFGLRNLGKPLSRMRAISNLSPENLTEAKRRRVEEAAQAVLGARAQFPDATLADLYDPNAMPSQLRKAHDRLDTAVDRCYRNQPFTSERQRLEFLFSLYEQLTAPLTAGANPRRRREPDAPSPRPGRHRKRA